MQHTLQEHSYYFLHHAQLSTLSPKIHETQNYAYRETVNIFNKSFHNLYSEGLIRNEHFENEYARVIETLVMSCIYWAPFSKLQNSNGIKSDFRIQAWSTMFHLLTDKGLMELKTIIKI
jgi:hypothetical protein